MCDISSVQLALDSGLVTLLAAVAFVAAAIIANGSFFGAAGSPALMFAAAASTAAAVVSFTSASLLLSEFFACAGSPPACEGQLNTVLALIAAICGVLVVQAAACLVVAGVSWIPWGSIPPMTAIAVAVGGQAALIAGLKFQVDSLSTCINTELEIRLILLLILILVAIFGGVGAARGKDG